MRVVIQRVLSATVEVAGELVGQIGRGFLVYLSVARNDTERHAEFIAEKIADLRIFADGAGKMNLNIQDVAAEVLLVSNFTLHADCRKGRRSGRAGGYFFPVNLFISFISAGS